MQALLTDSRLTERQKTVFLARYMPLLTSLRRKSTIVSIFYWLIIAYASLAGTAMGFYPVVTQGVEVSTGIAWAFTIIGGSIPIVLGLYTTLQLPKWYAELHTAADAIEDVYWSILESDLPDWQTFTAAVAEILKKHRQEAKEITAQMTVSQREPEDE